MVYCKELYRKKLLTGFSLTITLMLILFCFMVYKENTKTYNSSETVFIEYIPEPTDESEYPVYRVTGTKYSIGSVQAIVSIESKGKSGFGPNYNSVTFQAFFVDSDVIRIIIKDSAENAWFLDELPYGPKYSNNNYDIVLNTYPFGFVVTEKRDKKCVFNMTGESFYISERYIEVQTHTSEELRMGIANFREGLILEQKKFGIWTSEQNPGSHPYFISFSNKTATGYFLHNFNALEIEFQEKKNLFKTTGGVFDLFIILGKTGEEVTRNFHSIIGLPQLPLYSSLGYNYSPSGCKSTDELVKTLNFFTKNSVPLDGIWLSNILDPVKSFELGSGFKDVQLFIDEAQSKNVSVYIGIPSEISEKSKYFEIAEKVLLPFRKNNGNFSVGYLDWYQENADACWGTILNDLNQQFDGFYFKDNQVNTGQTADPLTLPFIPSGVCLECDSIPLDTLHNNNYTELDLHSLWASMQISATTKYLQSFNTRKPILSTSTRTGTKAGHIIELNIISFAAFRDSFFTALTHDFLGIRSGFNPCGSHTSEQTDLNLCIKWHNVGGFLPLFYNEKQEFISSTFLAGDGLDLMRNGIELRYNLSLYIYYLHFETSLHGGSILRPLLFEYFEEEFKNYLGQVLLGTGLLIVLPLSNEEVLEYFLPSGKWYDLFSGQLQKSNTVLTKKLDSDYKLMFIKGGFVIPVQNSKGIMNLMEMREKSIQLIISLDEKYEASGSFFVDDGVSMDTLHKKKFTKVLIKVNFQEKLQIKIFSIIKGYTEAFKQIDLITIFGMPEPLIVKISDKKLGFVYKDQKLTFNPEISTFSDTQINIIFK